MKLVIFGADGATGRHAVKLAHDAGHDVVAVEHNLRDGTVDSERITWKEADVLTDDLSAVVEGADAVLSCLGVGNDPATLMSPPPLYTEGTGRIVDAMKSEGVHRLIVISASFVETLDRGPIWFRLPAAIGLAKVFDQMKEMERQLEQETGIDWTAVRPGWLMEGELTDDYIVSPNVIREDLIRTRHADLAHFMVHLAETGEWSRAYPAVARAEADDKTSVAEVLAEAVT